MTESDIVRDCLQWLALKGIYAWRQNAGGIPLPGGGFRRFNGKKGLSDILGILPQTVDVWEDASFDFPKGKITRSCMFGNMLCIEVKKPGGRVSPEQKEFLAEINARGGIAVVVHSVEELERDLRDYL